MRLSKTYSIVPLLLLLINLGVVPVFGEGTAEPGPHAANFKLLNNGSGIDGYTGGLNWSYNLMTVPGRGGLDFPINLTYNSGIGVEQEASWVGLGFGLNLGSIERSVVFMPDDIVLYRTYGASPPDGILQLDGWLFDDNWNASDGYWKKGSWEKGWADGPDMWTVAIGELGTNLCIIADSSNISYDDGDARSTAGYEDWYQGGYPGQAQFSDYGRYQGLVVGFYSDSEYEAYEPHGPDPAPMNERQRICYVSPPMDTTVAYRYYGYSGALCLGFNDDKDEFGDNSGGCSVYVCKLDADSTNWEKYGPFFVDASETDWTNTGVDINSGDRFGIYTQTRKFTPENWSAWKVDYDIEFTDWGGYYTSPEGISNPWRIWNGGYTPRVKSFRLSSPEGTIYNFDKSDYIRATSRLSNGVNVHLDSMSVCMDYSWKLTSILSNDYVDANEDGVPSEGDYGNWIRIVYDESPTVINYANKSLKVFDAIFHRFNQYPSPDGIHVWQWHNVHYPKYIETPTHEARFYLSSRDDNLGFYGATAPDSMRPKKLDSLALFSKSPDGDVLVRTHEFSYADCTARPDSDVWTDGDVLAWHKHPLNDYTTTDYDTDSTGKLTLLCVTEKDSANLCMPSLEFGYDFNPKYAEQIFSGQPNGNVDLFEWDKPYEYYNQNWGYYTDTSSSVPADTQRAWCLAEIVYPSGAVETFEWESNEYCWYEEWDEYPPGGSNLHYKREYVGGSYAAQRGGVRLKRLHIDGGYGTDSAYVYSYGEGICTKPQTHGCKSIRVGYVGNSQEVGYRSSEARIEGESQNITTKTFFTNGSAPDTLYVNYFGHNPRPAVCWQEAFRDYARANDPDISGVNGMKRGLPYRVVQFNSDGDTLSKSEISYDFENKVVFRVDRQEPCYDSYGFARSVWVKRTGQTGYQFDEDGDNPIMFTTTYDYDTLNGLVTEEADSLGNGLARLSVIEYLHAQDAALSEILAQKNILSLVHKEELYSSSESGPAARTEYEYEDFGDGRIYLSRQDRYVTMSGGAENRLQSTKYLAYDRYGNPTVIENPMGIRTSMKWGYNGSKLILEAPNADTNEVSYNGFEDEIEFDDWAANYSMASRDLAYTGMFSGKVGASLPGHHRKGPGRVFADSVLSPNTYYTFSGWVYTTGYARFNVHLDGVLDTCVGVEPDHWERVEITFFYPESANGFECYGSEALDTAYFDDLRVHPAESPMQTFAYDRATGQLEAAFDANNTASERYHYDGFGQLTEISDPDDSLIASYEYYYSRSNHNEFDPAFPNYVLEYRPRSSDPLDASVTTTHFDGLGREIQRQICSDTSYKVVSGIFYNQAGQVSARTKPVEVCDPFWIQPKFDSTIVNGYWNPGEALTTGCLVDFYDSDGPGPDCHGYPYSQIVYSKDPLRRLKETGYPDTTWKVGSDRTLRLAYFSNEEGDVDGYVASELIKNQTIDEGGHVSYDYVDRLGRVVQTQVDSGGVNFKTMFNYDIAGNLTESVRQRSVSDADTTRYTYDNVGQLTHMMSVDGGSVLYLYDQNGNLRFEMDSVMTMDSQFVFYKYDQLGRMIEEGIVTDISQFSQLQADQPDFPTSSYQVKFTFSYDSLGLDFSRGRLASWCDGSGKCSRRFAYDHLGRVINEEVEVDDSVMSLSYTYDRQGNIRTISINIAPVFPAILYSYDMANRLTGVGTENHPYRYARYRYWPDGTVREIRLGSDTTGNYTCQNLDYAYNPRGWLRSINDTVAISDSLSGNSDHFGEMIGYSYSLNGDIDSIATKHSSQSICRESFEYDELHRLSRWVGISPADSSGEIYHYDRAGNFTYWKPASLDSGYTFEYFPGTNRLKRIHGVPPSMWDYYSEYDHSGNLVEECNQIDGCPLDTPRRHFKQEYRNIASRVIMTGFHWDNYVDYAYDADLQRVKKMHVIGDSCICELPTPRKDEGEDPPGQGQGKDCVCYDSTKTLYFYTYDGRLIREMVDGVVKRDYLWAGNDRIGVAERVDSTDRFVLNYFIKDHLGSTRQLVDSSGAVVAQYDYFPYGGLRRSSGNLDTDVRFTGKHFDDEEVEQYYYGKRYLNGIAQRFNSVDPEADEYPGWSPYAYTLCNPVRMVDPEGENPLAGILLFVNAALDVLDVYAFTVSLKEYHDDPGLGTGVALGADAAGLLPFAFGPGRIREGIRLCRSAWDWARGIGKADAVGDVAKLSDNAADAARAGEATAEAAETGSRSFESFAHLKRELGSAGEGKHWHHIVEQSQERRFGAEMIHNTENVVAIPKEVHHRITSYYSSKPDYLGGMRVREWLETKSFQEQHEFGMQTLDRFLQEQ